MYHSLAPWLPCFPTVRVIIPHPILMHTRTKVFQNGHLNLCPPLGLNTRWVRKRPVPQWAGSGRTAFSSYSLCEDLSHYRVRGLRRDFAGELP